jgi:hypothetical protein
MKISLPGIGDSLGECVLCGECFATEILLGQMVPMIGIDGFGDTSLPIHKKCQEKMQELVSAGAQWDALPDGPLRREYAEHFSEESSNV